MWERRAARSSPMRQSWNDMVQQILKNGDWVPGRAGGPGDEERREYVGKFENAPLDEALEGHSLVQVYAVLHDEMLVAGVEDLGVDLI